MTALLHGRDWYVIVPAVESGRYVLIAVTIEGEIRLTLKLPAAFNRACTPAIVDVKPFLVVCSNNPTQIFELSKQGMVVGHQSIVSPRIASSAGPSGASYFHIATSILSSGSIEVVSWQVDPTGFRGGEIQVDPNGAIGVPQPFSIDVSGGVSSIDIFGGEDQLSVTSKGGLLFEEINPSGCPVVGETAGSGKVNWFKRLAQMCVAFSNAPANFTETSVPLALGGKEFFEFESSSSHRILEFAPDGTMLGKFKIDTIATEYFTVTDVMFAGPDDQIALASTLDGSACGRMINLGIGDACERIDRWSITSGKHLGVSRVNWWFKVGRLSFRTNLVSADWQDGRFTTYSYLLGNGYFPVGLWRAGVVASS